MPRGRDRDLAAPALVLAGAGIATGAAIGGLIARRRRTAPPTAPGSEIARRLLEEPWRGEADVVDELVAAAYVGYDPAETEPARGPDGVRASIERYRAAFPDIALSVDDQICDGQRVASRWTAVGTHVGAFAGIPPTGRQVTVSGLTILRFEEGRAVEGWTSWDRLALLVQLGAVSEPAHAS